LGVDLPSVSLIEQLRAIERQYLPNGGGEAEARSQLAAWRAKEPEDVHTLSTGDATGAWLTLQLCERYGLKPFRRGKQRATTLCIRAPNGFMSKVFGPQLQAVIRVFDEARERAVGALATEWLGPERGDATLFVDKVE
jgi:hypothetical protein